MKCPRRLPYSVRLPCRLALSFTATFVRSGQTKEHHKHWFLNDGRDAEPLNIHLLVMSCISRPGLASTISKRDAESEDADLSRVTPEFLQDVLLTIGSKTVSKSRALCWSARRAQSVSRLTTSWQRFCKQLIELWLLTRGMMGR